MRIWDGLRHQPWLMFQSGGFSRRLPIGALLRNADPIVRNLRRSLSQSVFYLRPGLSGPERTSTTRAAAIESIRQIITRSELCPPHPAVEAAIHRAWESSITQELASAGVDHDGAGLSGISTEVLRKLLLGWAVSQFPPPGSAPIQKFDDEGQTGARQERERWAWFQDVAEGRLRRWCHPQILFCSILEDSESRDERRADFVLAPPWAPPLVWEVHGCFDAIDRAKDRHLRNNGLATFNDVVGSTTDEDRLAAVQPLACNVPPHLACGAFGMLLDACWTASQVDLTLFALLKAGIWSADRPHVAFDVPAVYREIVAEAAERFVQLARACDAVWSLTDHRLIDDAMQCSAGGDGALRVSIDPLASTYLAVDEGLTSDLVVRRMGLPFDLGACDRSLHADASVRGRRPETTPEESALLPILERCFDLQRLRPGQHRGIANALRGADALVLLPTGHGKSLIFQLAGLVLPGITIVVEAWRALIDDQVRNLQDRGIGRVVAVHKDRQLDPVRGARELRESTLVYVALERFYVDSFQEPINAVLRERGCDLLVVDEAHAVSEAGHSFRPSYLGLVDRMSTLCQEAGVARPPVLALTATAADIVVRDIRGILAIASPPVSLVGESDGPAFIRLNLTDTVLRVSAADGTPAVENALSEALASPSVTGRGIVFCVSKGDWTKSSPRWYGVDGARSRIESRGHIAAYYKGGDAMGASDRINQTDRFLRGEANVMVATDAFGAGIDLRDIRWIINIGLPAGLEAYYQQLGRAGRDGQPAHGFLIVDEDADAVLNQLAAARNQRDSFKFLRDLHRNLPREGLGSITRQLSFLVGDQHFDSTSEFDIERDSDKWLPSFPGWRFESDLCDARLVQALVSAGSRRAFEFCFHSKFDSLAWKAVNRLRELGLVQGSYRRTFAKHGLNRFLLFSTDLDTSATPSALERSLDRFVGRLRGLRVGRDVAARARERLASQQDPRERILFACKTMLRSTYEAVRDSRLGSLDGLRLYSRTDDLSERRRLIEDYFATDDFVKEIQRLAELKVTVKNWSAALDAARAEGYWRIGAFQRLAESQPGAGLPNFLVLAALLHEGRGSEAALQVQTVFADTTIPTATRRWAWRTLFCECGDVVRNGLGRVVVTLATDARQGDPAFDWMVTDLPHWLQDSDAEHDVAHAVVALWMKASLETIDA